MLVQFLYGTAGKFRQIGIGCHGEEASAGSFGEILQGFGVEFADDVFSVGILPEPVFTVFIGNGTACLCADTDGDDQQTAFFRFFCNVKR